MSHCLLDSNMTCTTLREETNNSISYARNMVFSYNYLSFQKQVCILALWTIELMMSCDLPEKGCIWCRLSPAIFFLDWISLSFLQTVCNMLTTWPYLSCPERLLPLNQCWARSSIFNYCEDNWLHKLEKNHFHAKLAWENMGKKKNNLVFWQKWLYSLVFILGTNVDIYYFCY